MIVVQGRGKRDGHLPLAFLDPRLRKTATAQVHSGRLLLLQIYRIGFFSPTSSSLPRARRFRRPLSLLHYVESLIQSTLFIETDRQPRLSCLLHGSAFSSRFIAPYCWTKHGASRDSGLRNCTSPVRTRLTKLAFKPVSEQQLTTLEYWFESGPV